MRHGLPPICPRCGQIDSVQRVRGLVASRNDDAANAMRAPQPPAAPAKPGTNSWLILALGWWMVALILLVANGQHDHSGLMPAFAWTIALGVPAAYVIYQVAGTHRRRLAQQFRLEEHREELEEYSRRLGIWDLLEFCHRCNMVFLPENEWQFEWNERHDPVAPHNAWWYATNLVGYLRSKERAVLILSGREALAGP